MCGVNVPRVFHWSVLAGGFAAALAGIMAAFYFGNMSFGTGLIFGLKILFITAVGGYDTPPRAALGAASFGMAESLYSGYFPLEWRDVAMFACSSAAGAAALGRRRDQTAWILFCALKSPPLLPPADPDGKATIRRVLKDEGTPWLRRSAIEEASWSQLAVTRVIDELNRRIGIVAIISSSSPRWSRIQRDVRYSRRDHVARTPFGGGFFGGS